MRKGPGEPRAGKDMERALFHARRSARRSSNVGRDLRGPIVISRRSRSNSAASLAKPSSSHEPHNALYIVHWKRRTDPPCTPSPPPTLLTPSTIELFVLVQTHV